MFFRDVWLCRPPVSDEVVQKCPDGERSGFFSRRANRLVIFSDIDGLYDSDPRLHSEARLLSRIECIDDGVYAMAGGAGSRRGRGGMKTKLQAVRLATAQGSIPSSPTGRVRRHSAILWRARRRGTLFAGRKRIPDLDTGDVSGVMGSAVAAIVPAGKRCCVKETAMNGSVRPQIRTNRSVNTHKRIHLQHPDIAGRLVQVYQKSGKTGKKAWRPRGRGETVR